MPGSTYTLRQRMMGKGDRLPSSCADSTNSTSSASHAQANWYRVCKCGMLAWDQTHNPKPKECDRTSVFVFLRSPVNFLVIGMRHLPISPHTPPPPQSKRLPPHTPREVNASQLLAMIWMSVKLPVENSLGVVDLLVSWKLHEEGDPINAARC